MTAIIKPFSGEVPQGAAQRYAQMYKLSAAENAMGRNVVPGWFVSEQIADLLATRNILPERLEITTRTPSGSATAEVTITVDRLYRNESRSLQRAADRLEKATTQPATKPAAAK